MIETFDALLERYEDDVDGEAFAPLRRDLESCRAALVERQDLDDRMGEALAAMEAAARRVDSWTLDAAGFDAIAGGIAKTYKRARKAMRAAHEEPSTGTFHEWRKRVKYHRYHLRLLRDMWRPVLDETRGRLHALSDVLGDEHDLAVLRDHLEDESSRLAGTARRPELLALIDTRRAELRAQAKPLGKRLFVDSPSACVKRLRTYWEARTIERTLHSVLDDGAVAI